MNEKKLKEILEKIYIEELLGRSIYNSHNNVTLDEQCDKLRNVAYEYELKRLKKMNCEELRIQVSEIIDNVHRIAITLPNYRKSKIFFNNKGEQTGLF